jgi:hypothetical protein
MKERFITTEVRKVPLKEGGAVTGVITIIHETSPGNATLRRF